MFKSCEKIDFCTLAGKKQQNNQHKLAFAIKSLSTGGVRARATMHCLASFSTWRKIFYCCVASSFLLYICFHCFLGFRSPFLYKNVYFESLRVAKLDFGIDVLTFKACQGNLSHFSNKVKFSHFCLCLVGQNFCPLTAFRCWWLA